MEKLIITIFLGPFGVHKFIDKKIGLGFLYLFTGGLFGIGWIIDIITATITLLNGSSAPKSEKNENQPKTYEVYYKPDDGFEDNMNHNLYECKGLYLETNRKKTAYLKAFNEEDAKNELIQLGYAEPLEIKRIAFPEATGAQINVLNDIPHLSICKYDASALISKKVDHDSTPNPELLHYATEMKIKLSYYIGKNALYDLIFDTLALRDKIAFFIFCVYRFTTDDRHGNLNTSIHKDLFYQFADSHISDESFIRSLKRYKGSQLKFFGTLSFDRKENNEIYTIELTGGSTQTIAYKASIDFLKNYFTLKNINKKSI